MQFSAAQLAQLVGGVVEGSADVLVSGFGKIEEAQQGQLSFLANPKYESFLYTTNASIVLLNESFELKASVAATLIRVKDAYSAFATLLGFYEKLIAPKHEGIEQPIFLDATAILHDVAYIGAFAYIGKNVTVGKGSKIFPQVYLGDNVTIGENTIINSGVKIYHNCKVGNNVIIHAGTVLGSDGFGFAPQADGSIQKVPQLGNVVVEDFVEIGANTVIDRATIGSTIIKANAKLDNLIQIAHNVEIGNLTMVAAQTGISGSTKVGNGVIIGGQAGLAGHLQIGDGVKINGQAGVGKSLKANVAVTGSPASDFSAQMRIQALTRQLPNLIEKIKSLELEIAALKSAV